MSRLTHVLSALLLGLGLFSPVWAYSTVSGNVSGQTWAAGTYHVVGTLTINDNSSLTLEPGAVLKFNAGVGIDVYGTLVSSGLEGQPVILTSVNDNLQGEQIPGSNASPTAGDWRNIYAYGYSSNDGVLQLLQTQVLYGGGVNSPGGAAVYGNACDSMSLTQTRVAQSAGHGLATDSVSPSLSGCTLEANLGHGLFCTGSTPQLTDNFFIGNGGWGALLNSVALSDYSGNTGWYNGVNGLGLNGTLYSSLSWNQPDPGFPFVLNGVNTISNNVTLTLPAGTLVKGGPQAQLFVNGSLVCTGTQGVPVLFVSLNDDSHGGDTNGDGPSSGAPGDWQGIYLYGYSSNQGAGMLDWTTILHAGGSTGSQGGLHAAYCDQATFVGCTFGECSASGLVIDACSPVVSGCTLRDNAGNGLYAGGGGAPVIENNTANDNGGWGIRVLGMTLTSYSGNVGSGNGINGFGLAGVLSSSQSWNQPLQSFPFVFTNQVTVNDNVTLSLPAGMLIKGMSQSQLMVHGTLLCAGTAQDPVRLVSFADDTSGGDTNGDGPSTGSPGDWLGVYAYGYSSSDGIVDLDWTTLRHAGGSSGSQGGLFLAYCDQATLDNCQFRDCSADGVLIESCSPVITGCSSSGNLRHGLYAGAGCATTLVDNAFTDNAGWGVLLISASVTDYSGNTGSGNGINGFGLSGTVYSDRSWSQPSHTFPFVLNGSITVNDNVTFTLPAGMLVKAADQSQLLVYGNLVCAGTEQAPVQLVSVQDDSQGGDTSGNGPSEGAPGDWQGVYCYGYSSNNGIADLDWTVLRHAGGSGASQGGLHLAYSDQVSLDDCTFGQCSASGVTVENCSPVLSRCLMEYNLSHGLYSNPGSSSHLLDNQFDHNGGWGVYLNSVTLTSYSGNTGTGNALNGLGLSGTVSSTQTWQHPDDHFPFVLNGTVTVNDDVSLNLTPGLVCKSQPAGSFLVYGNLNASGQATAPVRLTSLRDDSIGGDTANDGSVAPAPGDWVGVYLYGYSSNNGNGNLSWCYLDYAGNGQAAVQADYCDNLNIQHSRLMFSAGDGLRANYCSFSLGGSLVAANQGAGVFHNGYTATMGSCSGDAGSNCIFGNGSWALYNNTVNPIEACGNFWGSDDPATIDAMIHDDDENASFGAVDFSNFSVIGCAPVITSITAVDDVVTLEWLSVAGASGYIVYSSATPWGTFTEDTSGVFMGTQWMAPRPSDLHCYRITAILE